MLRLTSTELRLLHDAISSKQIVCKIINLNAFWVICYAMLSSADFFQNQLFRAILSGIPSEFQMVWIQTRPDVLSCLIWVRIVCKSYQQTTLVGKELIQSVTLHVPLLKFVKGRTSLT